MSSIVEIKPLSGFCSLTFGLFPTDAEKVFGKPEETQTLTDDIFDTESFVMHYWEQGFSLFFDNLNQQKFSSVEVDNEETMMFGVKIFDLNEKEIIELMGLNHHSLSDSEMHDWGEKRLSFDSAGVDFYFENNHLRSVNFGIVEDTSGFRYFPN